MSKISNIKKRIYRLYKSAQATGSNKEEVSRTGSRSSPWLLPTSALWALYQGYGDVHDWWFDPARVSERRARSAGDAAEDLARRDFIRTWAPFGDMSALSVPNGYNGIVPRYYDWLFDSSTGAAVGPEPRVSVFDFLEAQNRIARGNVSPRQRLHDEAIMTQYILENGRGSMLGRGEFPDVTPDGRDLVRSWSTGSDLADAYSLRGSIGSDDPAPAFRETAPDGTIHRRPYTDAEVEDASRRIHQVFFGATGDSGTGGRVPVGRVGDDGRPRVDWISRAEAEDRAAEEARTRAETEAREEFRRDQETRQRQVDVEGGPRRRPVEWPLRRLPPLLKYGPLGVGLLETYGDYYGGHGSAINLEPETAGTLQKKGPQAGPQAGQQAKQQNPDSAAAQEPVPAITPTRRGR